MVLSSVKVAGTPLSPEQYTVTGKGLTLPGSVLPDGEFQLEISTDIKPQENSLLEGLYKSGGNFCTQVTRLNRSTR